MNSFPSVRPDKRWDFLNSALLRPVEIRRGSVGKETGYVLDDRKIGASFLMGKRYYLSLRVQGSSGRSVNPATHMEKGHYNLGTGLRRVVSFTLLPLHPRENRAW